MYIYGVGVQIYDPDNIATYPPAWGPLGEIKYMYNKTESHYAVLTLNAMQCGILSVRKISAEHNVSIKQGNGWSVLTANPLQIITFKSGWDADSIIELKNNITKGSTKILSVYYEHCSLIENFIKECDISFDKVYAYGVPYRTNINYPDNMIFVYLPNDTTVLKPDDYVIIDYYGNICNSVLWAKLKLWWQVISKQLDRGQVGIRLDCYINAVSY